MSKTVIYNASKENRKGARGFVFSNGTGIFLAEGENNVDEKDYEYLIKNTEYAVLKENGIVEEKATTNNNENTVSTSGSQVIKDINEIEKEGKTDKFVELESEEPTDEPEVPKTNIQSVKVKKASS